MRIKQLIITVIAAGTIGTGMTSCTSKFDDYNTDPNATTTVTPGMLATNLIIGMMDMGGAKYSVYDNMRQNIPSMTICVINRLHGQKEVRKMISTTFSDVPVSIPIRI